MRALVVYLFSRLGWVRKSELVPLQQRMGELEKSVAHKSDLAARALKRVDLVRAQMVQLKEDRRAELAAEQKERAVSLSERDLKHARALAEQRDEYERAVAGLRLLIESHEERDSSVEVVRQAGEQALTQERDRHERIVAKLLLTNEQALARLNEKHERAAEERRQKFERAISTQREKFERALSEHREKFDRALGDLREKHENALAGAKQAQAELRVSLATAQRDAIVREKTLGHAMAMRELNAAHQIGSLRASMARFRTERDRDANVFEESALRTELRRISALARHLGGVPSSDDIPDVLLKALREGRVGVCSVRRADLLPDSEVAGRSIAVASPDQQPSAWLNGLGDCVSPIDLAAGEGAGITYDVVASLRPIERESDPIAALRRLAGFAAPAGRLLMLGPLDRVEAESFDSLWRAPPSAIVNALPEWRAERVILAAPGADIGLEIFDPSLLVLIRPAAGGGEPLLAPPFMHVVADLRQSDVPAMKN